MPVFIEWKKSSTQALGAADAPATILVHFSHHAESGKDVFVAGSFNKWDEAKDKLQWKGHGRYSIEIALLPGTYEYKFVADSEWVADVGNPKWMPNGFGGINSVVVVEASRHKAKPGSTTPRAKGRSEV